MGEFSLGEFLVVLIDDERVVQVNRAFDASERIHQCNLAGGGVADVLAAHDMRDVFVDVVNADGELVCPLAFAVADGKVSALEFRVLVKVAKPQIMPMNYFV